MKLKSWLKELPYTLLQGSLETEVDEVVYDSRKAAPGTVFVCMRGANVDSHTFIPDVVEKGAPVLVVEHPVEAPENVMIRVSSSVTIKPVEMASNSKPSSSQMARLWRTYSVVSWM